MTDRVKKRADLLLEDEMPACLIQLAANTTAYGVLAARWEDASFKGKGQEDCLVPAKYSFPRDDLDEYVPSSYRRLKRAQRELLGQLGREPLLGRQLDP